MNKQFAKRLEEYLDSECSDYGLSYAWKWCEDTESCEVIVDRDDTHTKSLSFRYDNERDCLKIEVSEDTFHQTEEYDETVKYFWILVAPALFPETL